MSKPVRRGACATRGSRRGCSPGTVEVRERRSDARATQVDVTYDLCALTPHCATKLDDFAAGYEREIGAWQDAIEVALAKHTASR